ncbi:MAG TPA: hypothetical protein PKD85_22870 [Saprospiraceae bacterium]|nr:hypothetical protein [Saprospiraceae bacterium]
MKYIIRHNSSEYIKGNIKLWFIKLYKRTILQRKKLSLIIISLQTIIYAFLGMTGLLFSLCIFIVLIIDLFVKVNEVYKEKKKTDLYIKNGGEDIEIILNEHNISLLQDNKLFKKTKWGDIKEIYVLKNPSLISYKNNLENFSLVLFENEIPYGFEEIKEKIISKSKVKTLHGK